MIVLLSTISCDLKSAETYYDEAIEAFDVGRWEQSIALLDKAIEKKPKFRIALLQRGFCKAFRLDKYEEGISDLKKILAFDPDNALALYYIGVIYGDQSEHAKAIEFLTKTIVTKHISTVSRIKVNSNLFAGYDDESLFKADGCDVYFHRGMHYVRISEFDKAIADLTKLVTASVYERDSYFLLAEAYLGKNDTINACENLSKSANLGDQEATEMLKKYCEKIDE